jgi:hypothetical protein
MNDKSTKGTTDALIELETGIATLTAEMRGIDTNLERFASETNTAISSLSANIESVARITQESITALTRSGTERDREIQQEISQSKQTNWSIIFSGASVFFVIIGAMVLLALGPINDNQEGTARILQTINERTYALEARESALEARFDAEQGRLAGIISGVNSKIDLQDSAIDSNSNFRHENLQKQVDTLTKRVERGFNKLGEVIDSAATNP